VQQYLTDLLAWQGFAGLTNEELTVMPGTEELFALLRIKGHAESGAYDTVIVDAARRAKRSNYSACRTS
jgi:arsenite-transporting ATPase